MIVKEPVNCRKFASDIDAGNKSEAEGNSGEEEGDEEDGVVAQLDETVQGVVQLASGLIHVELYRDEVEDDQHDTEDCNGKASLEADGIHRLDVVLLHELLLIGELAGIEGCANDNKGLPRTGLPLLSSSLTSSSDFISLIPTTTTPTLMTPVRKK